MKLNRYIIKKKIDDCTIIDSENEIERSLNSPKPKKYNIVTVNTKLIKLLNEESLPLSIL